MLGGKCEGGDEWPVVVVGGKCQDDGEGPVIN